MGVTGWIGEGPEEPQAGGFAGFILANRAPQGEGRTLGQVFARAAQARDREPDPVDPDDRMAAMVTRGYQPGQVSQLSQQLGDTVAELETEREKLGRGARRQEIAAREHAAGRADVWQMQRMLDGDLGDEDRVAVLERRAQSLRLQLAETQNMISPPQQRETDPVAAAATRARQGLAEVTRAMRAEARERSRPQASPPFDSVSRGRSTEHVPDGYCWVCESGRAAARNSGDAAGYAEISR